MILGPWPKKFLTLNFTRLIQSVQVENRIKSCCLTIRIHGQAFKAIGAPISTLGNSFLRSNLFLPSQSAPTILVLKNWVGLWTWKKLGQFADLKKTGWKKTGSGFFLLFKKRIGSLPSSLLDCKLQAEKIWSRPWKKIGLMQPYFF